MAAIAANPFASPPIPGLHFAGSRAMAALASGHEPGREYEIVLQPGSVGGYSVFVPELPSVTAQGETIEGPPRWPRRPPYCETARDH